LARLQNPKFVLVFAHVSAILHFAMDQRIQFASGFIVGRDDQCPLRFSCILSGNCAEPFLGIDDLMYTALLFEVRNCSTKVSAGELLYRLLEHWVLLAQNLIQLGRLHARLL